MYFGLKTLTFLIEEAKFHAVNRSDLLFLLLRLLLDYSVHLIERIVKLAVEILPLLPLYFAIPVFVIPREELIDLLFFHLLSS